MSHYFVLVMSFPLKATVCPVVRGHKEKIFAEAGTDLS